MAEKTLPKSSAEATDALFDDLFSTAPDDDNGLPRDRDAVLIERDLIESHPDNPRRYFPDAGLVALGHSMRETGQQQNIVVRPHPTKRGKYQLVAGERRWRAAGPKYGDITVLKAVVRNLSDYEVARIQIEENERREDVSPIARARGLQKLYDVSPGIHRGQMDARARPTWEQVARSVGLTRVAAARIVALLQLDPDVQDKMERLGLSEKHGRALLQVKDRPGELKLLLAAIEPDPKDEARELRLSGNGALRMVESWREEQQREEEKAAKAAAARASTWQPERTAGSSARPEASSEVPEDKPGALSTASAPIAELQRGTGSTLHGFDQSAAPEATPRAPGLRLVGEAREAAEEPAEEPTEEPHEATPPPAVPPGVREFQAPLHRAAVHLVDAGVLLAEYQGGLPASVARQWLQTIEEKRDLLDQQIERLRSMALLEDELS